MRKLMITVDTREDGRLNIGIGEDDVKGIPTIQSISEGNVLHELRGLVQDFLLIRGALNSDEVDNLD